MVSALFVDRRGVYSTLGVDCWGIDRDARLYPGSNPVVAHPPCQRWGTLGTPRPRGVNRAISGAPRGEDDGCFAAALLAVRTWGGVIEHPARSAAWPAFGLSAPTGLGWIQDIDGSWSALVYQSAYGHRAPKPTWLYYVGLNPPAPLEIAAPDPGGRIENMCKQERERTPPRFAEYLIQLASGAVCSSTR